jgi:hypothetical protein
MKKVLIILGLLLILLQGLCNKVLSFNNAVYTSPSFSANHLYNKLYFCDFKKSQAALSGDYTVGATGYFNTITAAVNALNSNGVSGPVRFLLCDALYTTNETFPVTFNITSNLPTSVNTVTIKPNTGVTSLIRGAPANDNNCNPVLIINNSFIIIDGSNSEAGTSRDLTIENISIKVPSVIGIRSSGTTAISGFTVKNCNLINGLSDATVPSALLFSNTSFTGGYLNNFTIQNNSIQKSYLGISLNGAKVAGNGSGTLISDNDMNTAGTNSISGTGIYIQGIDGITISNNHIGNFNSVNIATVTGITISSGTSNAIVSENTILNINVTSSTPASVSGINISGTNINVYKNSVSNIKSNNSNDYYACGILLSSSTAAANVNVFNNLIYDIAAYGKASIGIGNGYGINIYSGGGYNIYFNSVNLASNQTLSTGVPACLFINSIVSTANCLDIRNNIFSIPATVGANRYAVLCNAPANVFSNLNYNDYFTSGPNIGYLGSARSNLLNWQTATGKDQFSVCDDPGFMSNTDLQINVNDAKCWNVNAGAIPLCSVSTDFNNNLRSTSSCNGACDIGAFEFTPLIESAALDIVSNLINNGTSIISFAGSNLATITWHTNGGTLPSVLTVVYQPGVNPPYTSNVNKYANENLVIYVPDGIGYLYDISYHYNLARMGTIESEPEFRLAKHSNSSWVQYSQSPNQTNKTITTTGLNSFSVFSFGDGSAPLPVVISSFSSSVFGRNVCLVWKTENEINNAGFDIERKMYFTKEWIVAGHVLCKDSSNTPSYYTFTDKNLYSGKYCYRLKQIDYNGNFQYNNLSSVVEVSSPLKYSLSQNYPNPFNPYTNINFDLPVESKVTLNIYDLTGKKLRSLINTAMTAGYHTVQFDASALSSGIYFYTLCANSSGNLFIATKKMVILK